MSGRRWIGAAVAAYLLAALWLECRRVRRLRERQRWIDEGFEEVADGG